MLRAADRPRRPEKAKKALDGVLLSHFRCTSPIPAPGVPSPLSLGQLCRSPRPSCPAGAARRPRTCVRYGACVRNLMKSRKSNDDSHDLESPRRKAENIFLTSRTSKESCVYTVALGHNKSHCVSRWVGSSSRTYIHAKWPAGARLALGSRARDVKIFRARASVESIGPDTKAITRWLYWVLNVVYSARIRKILPSAHTARSPRS